MNWICSQLGAREHYAVPQALHQYGRLATLYTDFWAGPAVRRLAGVTGARPLHSLATRFHPELAASGKAFSPFSRDASSDLRPPSPHPVRRKKVEPEGENSICSWNLRALGWEWHLRRRAEGGERYFGYIEVGQRFAVRVREALKRRPDLGQDSIFFAYDTGALETMEWCREKGIRCILNQMDPNRVEVELVRQEENRWPSWAMHPMMVPDEYFLRREREWALADRVVVNSEFCRQALVKQGVSPEKLAVIPLCYEADETNRKSSDTSPNPLPRTEREKLRVLFLGQVILRKGIQYLIEAARKLENIQFDVVGPIGISKEAMATAPSNMTFHGRASRDQAADWYRQADVFVLPTLSDGFAITQLEAMAYGLPIVTTPCCGNVVSDGVDGFIVPAREADSLARIFLRYLTEPDLLRAQRKAALMKARQFTLNRLANNLLLLESSLLNR